jgi:predicted nuclease of predicted toxin-antitoxin system
LLLKILADENVDFRIIKELRNNQFDVISILETNRGISDKNVLQIAKDNNYLLLTQDRDFGILVFAYKEKDTSIIFLRYEHTKVKEITQAVIKVLNKYGTKLYGKFITITPSKIKIIDSP